MKHFQFLMAALASMLMVVGCGSDSDDAPAQANLIIGTDANVNSAIEKLEFSSNASSAAFRVKSALEWQLSGATDWCTVSRDKGAATSSVGYSITLNVEANSASQQRTATIAITSGAETKNLVVTQAGATADGTGLNLITASDPASVAKCLGLGWNLGNQMDAYINEVASETCWGNQKCTQATMDKIKAAGFSSVRIPTTWMGQIGEAPEYKIKDQWLNRVAEIVGYAEKAGLIAIVNIHHDGADGAHWLSIKDAANSELTNQAIKEKIAAVWSQIAERFKDKGNFLIFESFNEIHDGNWGWGSTQSQVPNYCRILNDWNQIFVDAVRATGGNNASRYLGIPGYCANPDFTMQHLTMPRDAAQNRILVAVHNYDPYDFTLSCKQSEWGHTAAKAYSGSKEADLVAGFKRLKDKYIDNDIAVYFGEMGCSNRNDERGRAFVRYYLEYFCRAARDYSLAPIFWDNGAVGEGEEHSAIFNHATGNYINNSKEYVDAMVKAITNTDAAYTLESVYETAPAKQ